MKLSVNQRIVIGFLVLLTFYGVSGYISLKNLDKSREITTRNSLVNQPSIILLNELELVATNARNYTNTWVTIDIADNEEKVALRRIHDTLYPALKEQLLKIAPQWNNAAQADTLAHILTDFEEVMRYQGSIMSSLQNMEAYQDYLLRVDVEINLLDKVNTGSKHTLKRLTALLGVLKTQTAREEKEILASFQSIRTSNIILTVIAILIGLIVAITTLRSVRLERQKTAIAAERDEVQEQKAIIEEKNREILDSITYAERIQHSFLPSDEVMSEMLEEYFVFYAPRDIVSGDFYWYHPCNCGENILIAAADATGHGVPGAFVSLVCYNGLNRTVNEFEETQPARILNKTTELVEATFGKYQQENVRDGMDIALAKINLVQRKILSAGAHNSTYIIRKGEIITLKADRQPVGAFDLRQPFTQHAMDLEPGDRIYLFSDGFTDQFGGPKSKKYKLQPFLQFLTTIYALPMEEQHQRLQEEFNRWKGNEDQLDDVLVIGIGV